MPATAVTLPEKIMDFHVHLFPDRLFDAIWKAFVADYGWEVLYKMYHEECIRYLAGHGVQVAVYSNYAHKKGVARALNEWNLAVLDRHRSLCCFAAYHPDDEDALDMAAKLLEHPRVLGFKLQLLVQRFHAHDPRLFPLYELVCKKKKRMLFHAGTGPVCNPFVGVEFFAKVMEAFPGLRANVAHMGGLEYAGFLSLLDKYENLCMDTSFSFLPTGGYNQGTEKLEAHKHRIVYGSDFPNLIFPREDEIQGLLNLNLSSEFYQAVFWENGKRLLEGAVEA